MLGLILGRRSGTSSLAKDLWYRGFPLREPLDVRSMKSQVQGHYESWESRQINREITFHFKMSDREPGIPPFLKYGPLMEWMNAEPSPFIVKDPKICMTWPIWHRSALAAEVPLVAVWCRRDKAEQVGSLSKWYGYDDEQSAWSVEMLEMSLKAAAERIETLEVHLWQDHDDRVNQAAEFFMLHGIQPGEARDSAPVDAREGGEDASSKEGSQEAGGGESAEGAGDGSDAVDGPGEPSGSGAGSGGRVEA